MQTTLDAKVFPSEENSIIAHSMDGSDAHRYEIRDCLGYNEGKTQYDDTSQTIQFVHKRDNGTVFPGLQSEQLVLVLLDRHKKLNERFPSAQTKQMIQGLQMFLDASKDRVKERIDRGVMGELKK
jgi:hypothetical protein